GIVNWIVVDVLASTEPTGIVNEPSFTTGRPLAACRLVPVMVTTVLLPTGTLDGLKPVIFGCTLKLVALVPVPASFLTLMGPVTAPLGTLVFTWFTATDVGEVETLPRMSRPSSRSGWCR